MADFTIKKGDTRPVIKATLKDANGVALNLTGTTVKLAYQPVGGGAVVRKTCTLDDAVNGKVSYAWVAGDTDTAGSYLFVFEVTYADTTRLSVPSSDYLTMDFITNVMAP